MLLKGYEQLWNAEEPYDPNSLYQLKFNYTSYQEDYDKFIREIRDSIGKKYLPIYRMADGEFMFSLKKYSWKDKFYGFMDSDHNLFSTCWGEGYSRKEINKIFPQYVGQLKKIANSGMFAIHFIESAEKSYSELLEPMMNWFDECCIPINENNYTSFYYIYSLFSGPHRREVLEGRNILIVTSTTNEKENVLRNNLLTNEKVAGLEFYMISPNKSFFEKLDLSKVKTKIDLVLIGAGVGSSNILEQLQPLNTVCIDAGIIIDLLANPKLRFSRIFLNFSD